jgi:methylmalonyl-CoA mutase N-terminal domain/subunit
VVGVNSYPSAGDELSPEVFRTDPGGEGRQLERLARVRADRDPREVERALAALAAAARDGANTVPPTIDAVRAYATVGEITDVLRAVHGSFRQLTVA